MTRYKGDPRWITTRFKGKCSGCQAEVAKGEAAFYFPRTSSLFGSACGCGDERSATFEVEAADEEFNGCL